MQIHFLKDAGQELATIDSAIRGRDAEIRRMRPIGPIERLYTFAGWTLDETTRDLINPAGQRVDLTSSEYDLLMAFLRSRASRWRGAPCSPGCGAANGRISIVQSIRWLRDCARSWPTGPTGLRSFDRCGASAMFSAPLS